MLICLCTIQKVVFVLIRGVDWLGQKSLAKGRDEKHQDRRSDWYILVGLGLNTTKSKAAYMYARSTLPCTTYEGLAVYDAEMNE